MIPRKPTVLILALTILVLLISTKPISAGQPDPPSPSQDRPSYAAVHPVTDAEGTILAEAYPRRTIMAAKPGSGEITRFPRPADLIQAGESGIFEIDYTPAGETDPWEAECSEFPTEAKTAYEYAASLWAATLHTTVPITIKTCWADLGSFKLGYSGGGSLYRDFPGAPLSGITYFSSLANALHGADLDASRYDMYITFNSEKSYYYGTDADPDPTQFDFVTLAAHEIGHGLNFAGTALYSNGYGFLGDRDGYPNIYDTFIHSGSDIPLTDYESPSINLGFALTSNSLWFLGPEAIVANGGYPVKIYAPYAWVTGSSYAHLDYETFSNSINNLMVYAMLTGSANHNTGPLADGLLRDLGWPDRMQPYPPEIVWASDGDFADKVRISWSRPSSATYFEIYRHSENTPVGATHLTPDPSDSPFDDIYATPGTPYYYWVKACNTAGCSELSAPDEGTRGIFPVPEIPAGVTASDGSFTDMVVINWEKVNTATYYKVYRDIDDSVAGAFLLADPVLGTETWDASAASLLYYYWVRACNSAGCSGFSVPDTGYTTPTGPAAPTGVAASDGAYKDKVEISWDASIGAKSYQIYRDTSDNPDKAVLLQSNITGTTVEDTSAQPATVYYYWVRACSGDVCSGYSSPDSGHITFTPPPTPLGVTASDGAYTDRVAVSWNASAAADYYRVFRNTENNTATAVELVNDHPLTGYDDLFAVPEVTYTYWIKACNEEGCSSYSAPNTGYAAEWNDLHLPLIIR